MWDVPQIYKRSYTKVFKFEIEVNINHIKSEIKMNILFE